MVSRLTVLSCGVIVNDSMLWGFYAGSGYAFMLSVYAVDRFLS